MQDTKEKTPTPAAPKADISFEVGFGKDKTRFDLNMISVQSETELQMQFNDISGSEDDNSEKEFEICKRALIRFSAGDASFIEERLGAFNIRNERIIRKAYLTFKEQLDPNVTF